MRRPVDAPLGDGTAEHALRNVGPAQDYPCPVGTPVRAPFAAKRIIRWGDDNAPGGYALSGYADNGDFWVLQHLSEYRNSRSADESEIVALSGDTGTQIWGAHLHHWVSVGGVRYNPEDIGLYDHPQTAGTDSRPFEEDDMFTDDDRRKLDALAGRRVAHTAAPINFRSTTGGVSYTMIPGIQIIRHENEIAAALTLEFVTGEKYPGANATQQQREAIGERQINDAEILVMLAKFGFEWASRDIARLPEAGKVLYADWIMRQQGIDISR